MWKLCSFWDLFLSCFEQLPIYHNFTISLFSYYGLSLDLTIWYTIFHKFSAMPLQIPNLSRLNCSISWPDSDCFFFPWLPLFLASPASLFHQEIFIPSTSVATWTQKILPTTTLLTLPLLTMKSFTLHRASIVSSLGWEYMDI